MSTTTNVPRALVVSAVVLILCDVVGGFIALRSGAEGLNRAVDLDGDRFDVGPVVMGELGEGALDRVERSPERPWTCSDGEVVLWTSEPARRPRWACIEGAAHRPLWAPPAHFDAVSFGAARTLRKEQVVH